jgi:hypothetical protein
MQKMQKIEKFCIFFNFNHYTINKNGGTNKNQYQQPGPW